VAKFSSGIYVLHAFQKKTGKTALADIEMAKKPIQTDTGEKMKEKIIKSSGNIFIDLGF